MAYSLEEMEEYLRKMYERAGEDLMYKAGQYMLDFKRLEEGHKKDVQSGKWTQDEFDTWRKNKLLYGMHWTRMIQTVQRDMAKVNQTALDYINGKIPQIFAQTYNEVAEKVPKSPVSGYSFELVNADTVKNLIHEEGIILPPKKNLDKQKDKLWNAKQVNAQLLQGILQGESIKKIAARMQNVANADLVGATRTARTMCTAAENSGRQSAYNRAAKDGIKFTKTWLAALQGNTRDTHKYLNQQTQPHNKPFESSSGAVLMFPGDWHAPPAEVYNCRCTMITNFVGFDKVKLEKAVEKSKEKPNNKSKKKNSKVISTPQKSNDEHYNRLLGKLDGNVTYRAVEDHVKKPTIEQIIEALSGGDRTRGSCASVALCYIGQRLGMNVLDFRDGKSRETFSSSLNLCELAQMEGMSVIHANGASSLTVAGRLVKQMEEGKEYYLCVGRHAAIVRLNEDGKPQYLELQSASDSGWKDFDGNPKYTLNRRFGCTSTSNSWAQDMDFMLCIDDSTFGDDFRTLLGFINTAEDEQRKGANGTIK